MKAIILAAGRGSRLDKLTDDKPKGMVELLGKPLIGYQAEALSGAGIEDIGVVTGYSADKISHPLLTRFFHNENWANTNMVASLCVADEWLSEEECIVSYADIFYGTEVVSALIAAQDEVAITYDTHFKELWSLRFDNPLDDVESFKLDALGYVSEIGKEVKDLNEVQGQYMGLLKFNPEGWAQVKKLLSTRDVSKLDMTTLLNALIGEGVKIKAVPISSLWGEVDHGSDLTLYEEKFADQLG